MDVECTELKEMCAPLLRAHVIRLAESHPTNGALRSQRCRPAPAPLVAAVRVSVRRSTQRHRTAAWGLDVRQRDGSANGSRSHLGHHVSGQARGDNDACSGQSWLRIAHSPPPFIPFCLAVLQ